jgi:type IV pilus assembly protein PilM
VDDVSLEAVELLMFNLGPVWGIDIGDSAVKAVKLKKVGKNQIALLDFHIVRYSDVGGELGARREGLLPQALAALQAAGVSRDRCFVSIAPQTVFSRFISLPPVDKRRIPEIVLYEARQQIPFNLNEVIWAYETVRKDFVPGDEIEIGLFAVKREVIDAYLGELAPLWQQLHGIQVSSLSLYNYVRHELTIEQPAVIIDIGAQSTDLLILDGQKFWLRNLPIAGNSFTSVLEKKLNIPRAEAEKLKLDVGDNRHRRKLLDVLRPMMRDMVAEVQRSVGYYKSLSQSVKFEEIYATGEGFHLFGLDRFLAEQLQYKITPLNQLRNIAYEGPAERQKELEQRLPGLSVAIGLALQGLGRSRATINLLPDDFTVQRLLHAKRYNGFIAAGLAWAIVGCFYAKEARVLGEMENMVSSGARTEQQVEKLKSDYATQMSVDPRELEVFDKFGVHREYPSRLIESISAVIPRDVEINGFRFVEPGASGPAAGGGGGGPGGPGGGAPGGAGAGSPLGSPEDIREVGGSKLLFTFEVTCEAALESEKLQKKLPEQIKEARISWLRVKLVKGVLVTEPLRRTRPRTDGTQENILFSNVTVGLRTPEELDALMVEEQEKRRKAQEEAAAKAKDAEAAKAREAEAAKAKEGAAGAPAAKPPAAKPPEPPKPGR